MTDRIGIEQALRGVHRLVIGVRDVSANDGGFPLA